MKTAVCFCVINFGSMSLSYFFLFSLLCPASPTRESFQAGDGVEMGMEMGVKMEGGLSKSSSDYLAFLPEDWTGTGLTVGLCELFGSLHDSLKGALAGLWALSCWTG